MQSKEYKTVGIRSEITERVTVDSSDIIAYKKACSLKLAGYNRGVKFKRIPVFVRNIISGNKSSEVSWFSLFIDSLNL